MKKLIISVIAAIFCGLTHKVSAQEPHIVNFNVNEVIQYYNNQLSFCDFDSITGIVIQRDTTSIKPGVVWIDANGNHTFGEYVTITEENDGQLVYIEMDSIIDLNDGFFHYIQDGYIIMDDAGQFMYCSMENFLPDTLSINLIENDMPAPSSDTAWLKESVWQEPLPLTLTATPEDMGYLYLWRSDCWPIDSTYQIYGLEVRRTGNYLGIMVDECLHDSQKAFLVEKAPVLEFVSTNREMNLNEIHMTPKGTSYDSVAIIKDDSIVAVCSKYDQSWIDPVSNNQFGTNAYKLAAYVNGRIIPESCSFWRTGVTLSVLPDTDTTIYFNFFGPNTEEGVAFNGYIKFFRLYSYDSNNEELIVDSIPNYYNAIFDIENNHENWYIAAVLWNGREIYSNIVSTEYITSNSEKIADKVQVYPNPVTNGVICVSADNAEYTITNLQGKKVQCGRCSRQICIGSLSSGVYIITLKTATETTTTKFVVE